MRAAELAEQSRDVLDIGDIERVHDMRVATRRLRAALEVFEPCFPKKRYREALREVKALADALGERRDRDVTIVALDGYAAVIGTAGKPGLRSLTEALQVEQIKANVDLEPFVTEERMAALGGRLDELVVAARAQVADAEPAAETATEAGGAASADSNGGEAR